jgi:hypothetical protein
MTAPALPPSQAVLDQFTLPARAVDLVVADVLQYELGLDAAHCVLGNQKYRIPADRKLFVVVFDDMGPSYGQATFLDTNPESPTVGLEVQQSTILHAVRAEVMGYLGDNGEDVAKAAAPRVAGALNGLYAQQQMGLYRFKIGRAQSPVPATGAEETAELVRYMVRVNVTALHQTVKAPPPGADYFDKFNGATIDGTINPPEVALQ